jgi:sec-independent protein translocase protein TatA
MGLDNPLHLAILLLIVLLIFGARRLPELGRSLGEGMRGFKDAITGDSRQDSNAGGQREVNRAPESRAAEASASQPPVAVDAPATGEPQRTEPQRQEATRVEPS